MVLPTLAQIETTEMCGGTDKRHDSRLWLTHPTVLPTLTQVETTLKCVVVQLELVVHSTYCTLYIVVM